MVTNASPADPVNSLIHWRRFQQAGKYSLLCASADGIR